MEPAQVLQTALTTKSLTSADTEITAEMRVVGQATTETVLKEIGTGTGTGSDSIAVEVRTDMDTARDAAVSAQRTETGAEIVAETGEAQQATGHPLPPS